MKRFYQLLRPFAFLSIKAPSLPFYRLYAPVFITVLSVLFGVLTPIQINLAGPASFSEYLSGFFVSLPGFYIAALAAIVAFQGGDLDREMPDAKVKILWNGDLAEDNISLRVFLSYLFSYLVVISFLGFFVCLFGNIAGDDIITLVEKSGRESSGFIVSALCVCYTALVVFLAASIVTCTMLGLYFLAERVHQEL